MVKLKRKNSGSAPDTYLDPYSTSLHLQKISPKVVSVLRCVSFPLPTSLMYCMYTVNSRTQSRVYIPAFSRTLSSSIKRLEMQIYQLLCLNYLLVESITLPPRTAMLHEAPYTSFLLHEPTCLLSFCDSYIPTSLSPLSFPPSNVSAMRRHASSIPSSSLCQARAFL